MADAINPREPNDGGSEAVDLMSWLTNLGAPDSLTSMLPKEIRAVDMTSVMAMIQSIPLVSDTVDSVFGQGGKSDPPAHLTITWLPITRD